MGMLVNLNEITSQQIMFVGIVYSLFAVIGKIIGCSIPALFLNFNWLGALRIGVGMVPRGEVALIIAGIGLSSGILKHEAFSISIIMTFLTTLITPPFLVKLLDIKASGVRKKQLLKSEHKTVEYAMPNEETAELIILKIIEAFENEGFYVHSLEIPEKLYHIRKNETFITVKYFPEKIVFDCLIDDVAFVHTLFYEVLAELERVMKNLKNLTDKESIGKKIFDAEAAKNNGRIHLIQVFTPLAVEVDLKGNTKQEIITEMITILVNSGQLDTSKKDLALNDLLERENNMSTGMQDGIALPHAKTDAVDKIIAAVGVKKTGVNFDSLDKKDSSIFVVTLAPKKSPKSYLQFMSEITGFLMQEENRRKVLECTTSQQLYQVFVHNK